MKILATLSIGLALLGAQAPAPAPPAPQAALTCAQMETFLKKASIGRQRGIPVGVTAPSRATLEQGTLKHDASIQTVDISKTTYQTAAGTELNFRDSWQFNVAGYELAKLLGLNMVPPYVERVVGRDQASLSWWISDAMMEKERFDKKIESPYPDQWNQELWSARVFSELIADSDVNMTNILITKDWHLWLIDFSRAFRTRKTIENPKKLTKIDRKLLANLRELTKPVVKKVIGRWLTQAEIDGVVARQELIVKFFDAEIAAKGQAAVLYDLPRMNEPCGTGLQ